VVAVQIVRLFPFLLGLLDQPGVEKLLEQCCDFVVVLAFLRTQLTSLLGFRLLLFGLVIDRT
jgi:hypothetical protein